MISIKRAHHLEFLQEEFRTMTAWLSIEKLRAQVWLAKIIVTDIINALVPLMLI
jgi:hypothetical protein